LAGLAAPLHRLAIVLGDALDPLVHNTGVESGAEAGRELTKGD